MNKLPRRIDHIGVPPIKCQGIKTKLVPFIFESLKWEPQRESRWIEPFLGSGVVAFNVAPENALLCDTNKHIIRFYNHIYKGDLDSIVVRDFLEVEGKKLASGGADYYYEVRERFNVEASPLDFLFLNRACFNGVMRFNRHGHFNVPFGHKPLRFSKAYITKIVNQVAWVTRQMRNKHWEFSVADWSDTLSMAKPDDFVYMDPPYIGRHTDYYNGWTQEEAKALSIKALALPCGFAASMWLENRHRKNEHVEESWSETDLRICSHFYHVGSSESLRNAMDEALLIRKGYATPDTGKRETKGSKAGEVVRSQTAEQIMLPF